MNIINNKSLLYSSLVIQAWLSSSLLGKILWLKWLKENNRIFFKSPVGNTLQAKSWQTEAPLRMLLNNLDPNVAENPEELIVYGGLGKAARNQDCLQSIIKTLKAMELDDTLLIQSGKPVGVFKTNYHAPRVLIANSNLVPNWSSWGAL